VEAEQQRADYFALLCIAEAADHAVGRPLLLDLDHRPFAGAVMLVRSLGDDAVERPPRNAPATRAQRLDRRSLAKAGGRLSYSCGRIAPASLAASRGGADRAISSRARAG